MSFENDTLSYLSRVEAQQSFRSMHEQYKMDSVHMGNNVGAPLQCVQKGASRVDHLKAIVESSVE